MRMIDLRSDTVTQPTPEMREVMYRAIVGDDVLEDDPTVKELEALAADALGKEAALFVTSGTQGNAVSVMAHTRRGDAIILSLGCHIADHEAGSYAMLAGVSPCFAEEDNGILHPESVAALIRDDSDILSARTGLVCLENAHSGGNVASVENMAAIYAIAGERGVPVHLDGARLYNAAVSLGVDVKELTAHCDSVMCCLSKGLCAPVGSVVAGSRPFIHRAKKLRKVLGGGMRQAGILAAAGILALTEMTGRLGEDHDNALYLADKLAALPGVHVDKSLVKINMVYFSVDWPAQSVAELPERLLHRGIKILPATGNTFRFVTNRDVTRMDCRTVIDALKELHS